MIRVLLNILCGIGVVYFILHFWRVIVLLGRSFTNRQRLSSRKTPSRGQGEPLLRDSCAFAKDSIHQ